MAFDANNRITGVTGVGYDLAENLTSDGSHTYFYDAENRLTQVDGTLGNCSTATGCYVYNAEGQRVRKTTGGSSMDHLYDLAGHKVTEVDPTGVFTRGERYAGDRHSSPLHQRLARRARPSSLILTGSELNEFEQT